MFGLCSGVDVTNGYINANASCHETTFVHCDNTFSSFCYSTASLTQPITMRTVYFCMFALALTSFVAANLDQEIETEIDLEHDGSNIHASKLKTCDQQSAKIDRQCLKKNVNALNVLHPGTGT